MSLGEISTITQLLSRFFAKQINFMDSFMKSDTQRT